MHRGHNRWVAMAYEDDSTGTSARRRAVVEAVACPTGDSMRLLTGKHRVEYETLIQRAAERWLQVELLQDRLKESREDQMHLREERDRERQRADNAVDALLAMRGIPPVSVQEPPPPVEDYNPRAEDPQEAERIEKEMLLRMARGEELEPMFGVGR